MRHAFRAMGTDVELHVEAVAVDQPLRAAEDEIRRLEMLLSRFLPYSELSRLNRDGELAAGPDLLAVVHAAVAARDMTAGRFDPTVHNALAAAGYNRTFELVSQRTAHSSPGRPCRGEVIVDRVSGRITLEPGVRLDLGGIAKGYAVDRALAILAYSGPALVDAGGDIGLCGRAWHVGVETPGGTLTLELTQGAVATSGRDRRRWDTADGECHHIIDPQTGRPAEGDILRVTVVAATAIEADVLAKALFLTGNAERAAVEADERRLPTVVVARDGRTLLAGGLA